MNDSWGFLFIAGSAGLVGYHPDFRYKKRLHQRKYFHPMQSSVFFNLEAKHFLTRKIHERKEPSVGFTSPLQR